MEKESLKGRVWNVQKVVADQVAMEMKWLEDLKVRRVKSDISVFVNQKLFLTTLLCCINWVGIPLILGFSVPLYISPFNIYIYIWMDGC